MDFKSKIKFTNDHAKHLELTQQLIQLIQANEWVAGAKMPTEEYLAQELGVSKSIPRQAYQSLLKLGWIKRIPKLGLIVQSKASSITFSTKLQSIGEDMLAMGLIPSVQFIDSTSMDNGELKCPYFKLTEKLLCVRRIILANQIPLLVMESYYSLERFPDLLEKNIQEISFFELLKNEYKITIHQTTRHIRPVKMQAKYAELLSVNKDSACHQVESIVYDTEKKCVEYAQSYAVGDRFSISL